jgi:hypothetical protein
LLVSLSRLAAGTLIETAFQSWSSWFKPFLRAAELLAIEPMIPSVMSFSSLQHRLNWSTWMAPLYTSLTMLRTTTASIARPLRSAANVTARRGYASHGPSYNAPSGYIFGEKVSRLRKPHE